MISQQALFLQMELKLQQAKQAPNEAQLREALSGLQTLCNLVLESVPQQTYTTPVPVQATPVQQQVVAPIQVKQPAAVIDDANGTSIFDF